MVDVKIGWYRDFVGAKKAIRLDGSLIHSSLKIERDRLYFVQKKKDKLYCLVTFHVISFWKLQKQYEFVCVFVICSHHLSSLSLHLFHYSHFLVHFCFFANFSSFDYHILAMLHLIATKIPSYPTQLDLIQPTWWTNILRDQNLNVPLTVGNILYYRKDEWQN